MIKRFWCIKFQKLLFFHQAKSQYIYIILATYLNDINTVCVKETRLFPVSFGRYMQLPWVTLEGQDVMALQLLTENSICDQSERHNHGNYCCLSSPSSKLNKQKWVIDSLSSHCHGDIITWKHFPHYRPFLLGINRSAADSLNKGQWCGALMSSMSRVVVSCCVIDMVKKNQNNHEVSNWNYISFYKEIEISLTVNVP